ncbi:acetyltransferase [Geobacter sp.]|uniref:acetyltransferase n=1 Tax=Geobacter sp. TaxID=46610 RepID=UPI00261B9B87|nr:acetyltransferase [Geobacter sp.]
MRSVLIWGCGGHGREVNWLCEQAGIEVVGFLDERPEMRGVVIDDVPVLGDIVDVLSLRGTVEVVCAGVGSPSLKKKFFEKTRSASFTIAEPIVHPAVTVSKRNRLGIGCVVCEGTVMTVNIDIGHHVVINRIVNIGHDCVIGDFSTIAPGVNLSGNVYIGEGAYIGTGASIKEKTVVGDWSMVGGGAFVRQDVPARTMYAGVPARFVKQWK